jgi:hypothetical protein
MTEESKAQPSVDPRKAALNKNLETAAWDFFCYFSTVHDLVVLAG